jgi:hypothetical protein
VTRFRCDRGSREQTPEPVIPFSPSLPNLRAAPSLRAYSLGPYTAFLVEEPKPLGEAAGMPRGLVKYLFALAVATTKEPRDLVYVVTSEQTGELLKRFARQEVGAEAHPELDEPVLCTGATPAVRRDRHAGGPRCDRHAACPRRG